MKRKAEKSDEEGGGIIGNLQFGPVVRMDATDSCATMSGTDWVDAGAEIRRMTNGFSDRSKSPKLSSG